MESVERTESLYISLAKKSSERLEAAEETISILKQVVINSPSGVSTSKRNVPNRSLLVGQEVLRNLKVSCGT